MRMIVAALLASVMAITSVGASAAPVEAGWNNGWFNFGGTAKSMTRTFWDGSPARTPVVLYLQKKAGWRKCRAKVIIKSGGYVSTSRWIYKYSRTRSRGYYDVINWPNRARRTTVTVKTNGRCIFWVNAK
jgi:hypothetical protein